jgi:alcohol dehydrogenase YqhD (iron-dependent ADH family)
MNNFTFYNPTKLIFGKNTIQLIGREIKRNALNRVLLLAGSGSIRENGSYLAVSDSLKKNKIEFVEKWGVRANPTLNHAIEAIQIARQFDAQAILAVGGGSVIDESKAVATGFYLDNLWDAYERNVAIERALPVFTVLTLSGTCSEMDCFAVLSNQTENKKWNIGSELLFPKVSIVDPSIQMSLPWHQTVNGAIDAMSHIMEFYFLGTNEEIALNGTSGVALQGGDWATHRMEHALSAFHPQIAHGAGLAVMFPAWIKFNYKYYPEQFQRWAKNVWNADSIEEAIEAMKAKYHSWKAPISLRELDISKEEIPLLAENALGMGPIGVLEPLPFDDIIKIYEMAF